MQKRARIQKNELLFFGTVKNKSNPSLWYVVYAFVSLTVIVMNDLKVFDRCLCDSAMEVQHI